MDYKKARLIVTFDCIRQCSYCCNNYKSILDKAITITDLKDLSSYGEVMITGGEPLLNVPRTLDIIKQLRKNRPGSFNLKIFVYSAWYSGGLYELLPFIDGLHYTIHKDGVNEMDMNSFYFLQQELKYSYKDKSYRLYIHPEITRQICVAPYLWKRIESKPWLKEEDCHLPEGETLYIYEEYK